MLFEMTVMQERMKEGGLFSRIHIRGRLSSRSGASRDGHDTGILFKEGETLSKKMCYRRRVGRFPNTAKVFLKKRQR